MGFQPAVTGDRVSFEPDLPDFLLDAFVDQVDRAAIVGLCALEHRDLGFIEPLGLVERLDLPAAFLDRVGVERIALLQSGLLGQRFG